MREEGTGAAYKNLYGLLGAWCNGVKWEEKEVPDFRALFYVAKRHKLTAALYLALEQAQLLDSCPPELAARMKEVKLLAERRAILMDAERRHLSDFMEEKGIWHLPLKGIILKNFWPFSSAREMADNDILFDCEAWKTIRSYMRGRGYWEDRDPIAKGAHDTYIKPPCYRFEMHPFLFAKSQGTLAVYYENVKERLRPDPGKVFAFRFGDEDFYVYFLAHAYKHYRRGGIGVRTLLDIYLYRRQKTNMDETYIAAEAAKLGIGSFEPVCRSLACKLFSSHTQTAELTEEEADTLAYMEEAGAYGTLAQKAAAKLNELREEGEKVGTRLKLRYVFRRLFPKQEWYRAYVPFVYRHRWALPFYWLYRLFRGVVLNGERNRKMLRAVLAVSDRSGINK